MARDCFRSPTFVVALTFVFLSVSMLTTLRSRAAEQLRDVEIERMTSPEVADAIAHGYTTIIIPTGGTEQNGPHMVLGKHNFIVAETARRIARKLGNALVAPVMTYVPEGDIATREGHMAYPGTISLPPAVFVSVLENAAASFRAHGFKTIVLLGDSGPNQAPQKRVADALSEAWANDGVRVIQASSYYADNGGEAWLVAQGETKSQIGTHAGIRDTSELMAVYPDGIRKDKLAADEKGVVGDPTRASAERGEKLLDLKVEAAVRDITAGMARP
ncbi:MAG: creatininase family protein [Hyphomicrobiaceae bacterium]